jgi:DNA-binding CsgD family transcriptional regulator
MDYFNKFIESDSFASVARTIITTAEDITFTIIDDEMKIRWVNDLAVSLAAKTLDEIIDTDYLSWYENELDITEHQFAQAREKGLSDNAVVTASSGAYVRRRIFKIEGGYISVCIDFSRIADARQQSLDIDATLKVLADSKNRVVREAQLKVLDMMEVHCQALCRYHGDWDSEPCPAWQRAQEEIQKGRPYLEVALTKAELNVAHLVREGLSRKEIANRLGISENTVRNHSTAIRKKCRIEKRGLFLSEYLQRYRL